jgi:thiosulfate/3-mercaptopyruvate sulfurtransferase
MERTTTISVAGLRTVLAAQEPVVVLDARQHYTDPTAPRRMWVEERIPGAAHLDMATAISGPRRPDGVGGRNPMPTPAAFLDGLNRAGARGDTRIVAYDERMEGVAARVWWIARELGLTVEVLEGGLAAWKAAGGPTESGGPTRAPERGDLRCPDGVDPDTPVGSDGRRTVTAQELLEPDPSLLLLDVRTTTRYRGDEEPLDPIGGHIRGAVNIPNVGDDGLPTPASVLADLVAHDGEVVASCGSGVSACLMLLRLAQAGRDDAKLYPGSWSEWLALGLPYATGDDPR